MKRLSIILLFFAAASAAFAEFDAKAWLEKRERMTAEALRLRAAYTNCAASVESPAEDVSVSVETFDDGTVKTSISAKRAQFFLDSGLIWAEGVVLKKFKRDGALDAQIDAENCIIDRNTNSGWADGAARIAQGPSVFSGKSVFFSSRESYVKVFSDTDMESEDLKMTGGLH